MILIITLSLYARITNFPIAAEFDFKEKNVRVSFWNTI